MRGNLRNIDIRHYLNRSQEKLQETAEIVACDHALRSRIRGGGGKQNKVAERLLEATEITYLLMHEQ